MSISVRQLIGAVVVSFSVGALVTPASTQGQGAPAQQQPATTPQPTFMLVQFMKVTEGKQAEWLKLESETWKPLHELRVNEGGILSWAAMAQAVPGDESDGPLYATITTFRGWPDPTKTDWTGLMKKAHPQAQTDAIFQQTEGARQIVRNEIWQVLDQTERRVSNTR